MCFFGLVWKGRLKMDLIWLLFDWWNTVAPTFAEEGKLAVERKTYSVAPRLLFLPGEVKSPLAILCSWEDRSCWKVELVCCESSLSYRCVALRASSYSLPIWGRVAPPSL